MSWLAATGAVARRELLGYLRSPVAWLVAAGFLALEGASFAATVRVLADPAHPADYGAVLRGQFAGSLLGWLALFAVAAAATMRLFAEERSQGTFETLVTAPIAESAVTAGKWLAGWAFLVWLWLPTLAYPLIVAHYAPPDASLDLGPLVSAYLGVVGLLAALAAVGLLASAATASQVVAAIAAFASLVALLLLGEVDEAAPDLIARGSRLHAVLDWVDLRRRMDDFARGAVDLGALAYLAGLTVSFVALAHAVVGRGRIGRRRGRRRVGLAALVVLDAVLGNLYVARHAARWDLSAGRVNQLEPATAELVAALDQPLVVTVVRPALAGFDPVYLEVDRLVAELEAASPRVTRRDLDPLAASATVTALAERIGAPPDDLAEGGAVVVELGGRTRLVELLDMASFASDAVGAGAVERLTVERAVAGALAELVHAAPLRVCFTAGHGELALDADDPTESLGALAAVLAADGMAVETIGPGAVPSRCGVVVVAGPSAPLAHDAVLAVDRRLTAGGALLVLCRGPAPTGLELSLAVAGLSLGDPVDDPEHALAVPGAFAVVEGYADHPVSRSFQGRRLTVWPAPREIALAAAAAGRALTPLVVASSGRAVVAAAAGARGARVAVVGSAAALADALAEGAPANLDLARRLIAWLGGRDAGAPVPDKTPEHLRLLMTAGELGLVTGVAVVGMPLVMLAVAAAVARRRRRG